MIFNILIVDDKTANVYALKELISRKDIHIHEAFSGQECLRILLEKQIDLILLDIQMPDMDGYETAQFIHENDKTKSIPIIFITAARQSESINLKGYKHGAIDILYKPINEDILKSKISIFLEMAATRIELQKQVDMLTVLNEENRKMQKEIEHLAMHDYLTQIPNRRKLDEDYHKYYLDSFRHKKPISLLMIDLDNFKGYNDFYGHSLGDEALKKVAQAIQKSLRRSLDTVGRYGGEEFLVVLPNTDESGALNIAKSILKAIRQLKIKQCPFCVFEYLTASIGVATIVPQGYHEEKTLLQASDQALYKAKAHGKNQVAVYEKKPS